MWRSIIITQGEKVTLKDKWLVVESSECCNQVPIDDIYSIVVDNRQCYLTVAAITALTNAGVHILYCDEKHQPVSVITSFNTHYRPLNVIRKQLDLRDEFKDTLWQRVIKGKIENQAQVLKLQGRLAETISHLLKYKDEVLVADKTNREGLAAKMYFRSLYGSEFIRMSDNCINSALNYGYAIIRSAVAKTLVAYGYNCVLGIHHISETNPFNLADDFMEPFRPIVDLWTDIHHEDLVDELSSEHKKGLVNVLNTTVLCNGKNMKVRYAIDKYISSFTSAIEKQDVNVLEIPKITKFTLNCGVTGDD
ncbi:MAG: type II CRISPR-associated endonuclease Cas1 [Eubacteriales bacterium]|nr:type II CRISPR-associated endonuclease Cas1 [Eubacteriales bacterium]